MWFVEEVLLKERNWKHYYSSTRQGLIYKEYEECGLWKKYSVHLLCMCVADETVETDETMLKTSAEGV